MDGSMAMDGWTIDGSMDGFANGFASGWICKWMDGLMLHAM